MKANNPALTPDTATHPDGPLSLEHPLVIQALEEYQTAFEAGARPDRQALLARFPSLADDLGECLEGLEMLHASGSMSGRAVTAGPEMQITGEPLGDYRLLREVGRGGMGIVYEAEQLSLGRHVALKVLPFAATLDPRQLQRFKNEAHAAACLHHPNIVPVYAVGQERGVHFYAMQFIDGQSLAVSIHGLRKTNGVEKAERGHSGAALTVSLRSEAPLSRVRTAGIHTQVKDGSDDADPAEPASQETASFLVTEKSYKGTQYFRTVARLGAQAAEALDHAHQLGVVHRDIKPANLLLDGHGQLWITDFGLARLESDADLTMSGDLIGTLRYMSPEQALAKRGVVDHRTDIYSLGATLYELLTLHHVFDGGDRQELLDQIANEEPRSPRKLNKAIPVDLETIVLKSLAKRPEERYTTAQEFADDLRRFMSDQPIHARRPSLATHLTKWMWRHRTLVACGIVLLMLAVLGLSISNYRIWQEQQNTLAEKANTTNAYKAEAKQRQQAESNFQQARVMLDFFTKTTDEELAAYPAVQQVRRKMLQKSLAYYKDFIQKAKNNPDLQNELSESHFHVATILTEMGQDKQAQAAVQTAFHLKENLLRQHPENTALRQGLTEMYERWGMMKYQGIIRLLSASDVRKALKLSKDESKKIENLLQQHRDFFWNKRNRSTFQSEQVMKEFDAFTLKISKQIDAALSAKQMRRLEQISLQQRGVFAFKDEKITKLLQLTDEQKAKIKAEIDKRFRSSSRFGSSNWRGGSGRGGSGRGGKSRPSWDRGDDRLAVDTLVKLLTPEQKRIWQQMTGARFTGRVYPRFGFSRSRGRGGQPGFSRGGQK